MNNSQIAFNSLKLSLEEESEKTESLKEREAIIVRILEAIKRIKQLEEWHTLSSLIFNDRIESLERQMKSASESQELNTSEVYRLQGRLFESRKYDLEKLKETYKLELSKIRRITQPTER